MTPSITHLGETGSTNDWLAERRDALADEAWVRADAQTGGRGRRGRAWASLPGNVFASVLVKPRAGEGPAQELSFVAAVALARALDAYVAFDELRLKWPNDLLLRGRKVSGILLEGQGGAVIAGFGVNLAVAPGSAERPATCLAETGIAPPEPGEFVERLAATFASTRAEWRAAGFGPIRAAWLARAHGIGARLEARLGSKTLTGVFEDLADDGALRLRLDDGTIRAVHAGEVFGV